MAIKWIEGFEGFGTSDGSAPAGMTIKYGSTSSESSFTLRAGRIAGHACEFSVGSLFIETPSLGSVATQVVGFGFKVAAYNSAGLQVQFRDGATVHITAELQTSGEWRVYRGTNAGTVLGTTSGAGVSATVWAYFELKCTIDDTAGVVILRINGTEFLNLTSQDTRNAGNATTDRVRLISGISNADDPTVDDLYILDTTGSAPNNDLLGSQVVKGIFPDADGDLEEWANSTGTDAFALVDDNPHNSDTDYIESGTSGQRDLFNYAAAASIQSIKAIQINTVCRETDANPFSLHQPVKSGATTSDGSATAIGTTSYKTINRIVEQDPNTAAAWTLANLNAAQFGVKVQ